MNLQFITSVSKQYWHSVGKHCIPTWQLPGEVIVYIDQKEGDVDWFNEIPFTKRLLHVPKLETADHLNDKTKVRKFWGKACAQIHAVRNRPEQTRVIWLDSDMEQLHSGCLAAELFNGLFYEPVALMRSSDTSEDRFETGLVIFNQLDEKLSMFINKYEKFWKTEDDLTSVFRPYDAYVLGSVAESRKYRNLCERSCDNIDALKNTRYGKYFKHWINKANKQKLIEERTNEKS